MPAFKNDGQTSKLWKRVSSFCQSKTGKAELLAQLCQIFFGECPWKFSVVQAIPIFESLEGELFGILAVWRQFAFDKQWLTIHSFTCDPNLFHKNQMFVHFPSCLVNKSLKLLNWIVCPENKMPNISYTNIYICMCFCRGVSLSERSSSEQGFQI